MEILNYIMEQLKERYTEGVEISCEKVGATYNLTIIVRKGEDDFVTGNIGVSKDTENVEDVIESISSFIEELIKG